MLLASQSKVCLGIAVVLTTSSCATTPVTLTRAPRALVATTTTATTATTPPPSIDVCAAAGTGTDLSNRDLHDVNFHSYPPGSLVGAKFDKSDLHGASFAGQDLTGASFRGSTLGASATGPSVFTHATLDHTCFKDATLNDAQFAFARMHCADFSNTTLIDAQFGPHQWLDHATDCRTRFIGTTIDVHAITRDHWPFADFTNAKFRNYTSANFTLAGLDLTGVMLAGTVLPGIDMTAANLTAADLSHAQFVRAILEDSTLNGALLIGTNLGGAHLRCARFFGSKGDTNENPNALCQSNPESSQLLATADLSNVQLRGSHLEYVTLNKAQMRGAILDRTTATHASFVNASFIADQTYGSASFEGADLSQAKFSGAHLEQVSFDGTILPGADFSGTTLQGTSFENAIAPGAIFSQTKLEGVNFKHAVLQSASFVESVIQTGPSSSEVIFTCANLGGSDFSAADVKQARFNAAVMPGTDDCCAAIDAPICGTVDLTRLAYGPTKFPTLTAANDKVRCPNGDYAPCTTWRVPGWRTDLCNVPSTDRTVKVVWTKPDCGSPPADVVTFDDENLHKCVSEALPGKPTLITKEMAAGLTELRCAGRGIERLGGLDAFSGLVALNLSDNHLRQFDVQPSSPTSPPPLARVRDLKIANNQLTTLNVATMARLSHLDASNNRLVSVGGLASVYPLVLDLSQNQLITVDLAIQTLLTYANLSANQLTSIVDHDNPDLSGVTNLSYLDVSNNTLTTIGSVTKNTGLSSLILACNPQFDCSTLGVDATSPLVQNSQCAFLDKTQNPNKWTLRSRPQCQ